jgi:5'/3'-nucleotidase
MRILITNDDGIQATGLAELRDALSELGEVWVVAPDSEQSAVSHALTLRTPLRLYEHGNNSFSVTGTPTDCILMAVRGIPGLLEPKPDLIVSGINHGPNMGDDVTYSGTVAGAFEGRLLGLPAIAFSSDAWKPKHLAASARFAKDIVKMLTTRGLSKDMFFNVNFPDLPYEELKGLRITKLGYRAYRDEIVVKADPRGKPYYWIGGEPPTWDDEDKSDFCAVQQGYVSLTPLQTDWTHYHNLESIADWGWETSPLQER